MSKIIKVPEQDERNNEGLLTAIWGPSFWHVLHCISFNYPKKPTVQDKEHYTNLFKNLCYVLPCCECRNHYSEHIKNDETELTHSAFENRDTLTKWLFDFHMCVNKKLGVYYDISYESICEKYNSFIATCELTPEQKAISYKNFYNKEAPLLKYEWVSCFDEYAKSRGLNDFMKDVNRTNKMDRNSDEWFNRNEICWEIIKKIRINAVRSVEETGEFKGFPTVIQLHLMKLMCTTIPEKVILHLIKKLGYDLKMITI